MRARMMRREAHDASSLCARRVSACAARGAVRGLRAQHAALCGAFAPSTQRRPAIAFAETPRRRPQVRHVVMYDVPRDLNTFIHRGEGRPIRAGAPEPLLGA
eukprot:6670324-Prymnesium_polylepis.1